MNSAKADIKTVSESLGHATVAFTLDVYGHVTDKMKNNPLIGCTNISNRYVLKNTHCDTVVVRKRLDITNPLGFQGGFTRSGWDSNCAGTVFGMIKSAKMIIKQRNHETG